MALVKCKECNNDLSSTANKCPHCGKLQKNWFLRHKVITTIVSIFLFLVLVVAIFGNNSHKVYYEGGTLEYEGGWEKGYPHGSGKAYNQYGMLSYEGDYVYGLREGKGKLYNIIDNKYNYLEYEGSFKEDLPEGQGTEYYEDGMTVKYRGEWKNGNYHGKGVYFEKTLSRESSNGFIRVLDGEFADGKFTYIGTETCVLNNNKIYTLTRGIKDGRHAILKQELATNKEYINFINKSYDQMEKSSKRDPEEGR